MRSRSLLLARNNALSLIPTTADRTQTRHLFHRPTLGALRQDVSLQLLRLRLQRHLPRRKQVPQDNCGLRVRGGRGGRPGACARNRPSGSVVTNEQGRRRVAGGQGRARVTVEQERA